MKRFQRHSGTVLRTGFLVFFLIFTRCGLTVTGYQEDLEPDAGDTYRDMCLLRYIVAPPGEKNTVLNTCVFYIYLNDQQENK